MFAPFARSYINLCTDRISKEDGNRQQRTADEILHRLGRQPGVVLADEVGMGKTFVAMAVAASIIINRPDDSPVVVMVPPSLRDKWPKDWQVFQEKCLNYSDRQIRYGVANSGIEFLKLLDDPPERKRHIVFLTHGALHRSLTDGYAKLAVIKRAFKGRASLADQRKNFYKFASRLLRMESIERRAPGLLGELLERPIENWLRIIHRAHDDFKRDVTDDPVPQHLQEVLEEIETEAIYPLVEEPRKLPLRESSNIEERLREARRALASVMSEIWRLTLKRARFQSPLLILDEAHHLKNPTTRLASLFIDDEAAKESEYFTAGGELGGKFERMLFLTATPFQLGHAELVRVLERFDGIAWHSDCPPKITREEFRAEIASLEKVLNDAQIAALHLDRAWGKLSEDHLIIDGRRVDVDEWWERVQASPSDSVSEQILMRVDVARQRMRAAEGLLRPLVLRHLRSKNLPDLPIERRIVLPGAAISDHLMGNVGLEIEGDALFPFLLAGRAQAIVANSNRGRALFAEGLASSFEAYVETRSDQSPADEDGDLQQANMPEELNWYLSHLDRALPLGSQATWESHPKIRATTERVIKLWAEGEKVLVFCHYRATGRALRRHISSRLDAEIIELGRQQLPDIPAENIRDELERIGDRFFDTDGSLRNEVEASLQRIIEPFDRLEPQDVQRIIDVVRRFLRTPSFLVRYFDLSKADHATAFAEAIERWDLGGLSLRQRINDFCSFLAYQCIPSERRTYLDALDSIQTGSHVGHEIAAKFDPNEVGGDAHKTVLLPNVRLANGLVNYETRRKLLLAFNTPLFPEILIASSVLAEGVDLHVNCRHIIHHDLCWNPSTLEQRTGRVDRLGSLAERIGESICVYLPYIAATQDEKMYRVVRDRERWFQIVMGEKYEIDEAATDRRAQRIPLPQTLQDELTLKFHV